MEHLELDSPEREALVNLCMMNLEAKGFFCTVCSEPPYDLQVTYDGKQFQHVVVIAHDNFSFDDAYLRGLAEIVEPDCLFYIFFSYLGHRWQAVMEQADLFRPNDLLESFDEKCRDAMNDMEGERIVDFKLSEDPTKWVHDYLIARATAELDYACKVEPAIDPQFDLYAIPSKSSEYKHPFHIIIIPIVAEDEFGSVSTQIAHIICNLEPVDKDENYLVFTYDTRTGETNSFFYDSDEAMHHLLNSAQE